MRARHRPAADRPPGSGRRPPTAATPDDGPRDEQRSGDYGLSEEPLDSPVLHPVPRRIVAPRDPVARAEDRDGRPEGEQPQPCGTADALHGYAPARLAWFVSARTAAA